MPTEIILLEHWLDVNLSVAGSIAIPAIITALLMPIAIFLMERQDKYEFDKSVIVDKILIVRWLVPVIIITSLTLLYHSSLLFIICMVVLIAITAIVLYRTYRWMKSYEATTGKVTYRQQKRLSYLRNLKNDNDRLEVWMLILNDDKLTEKNQQGIVSEYVNTVNKMRDKKSAYLRTNMHLMLTSNLNKINFSSRESYDELLAYSLNYFKQCQLWRNKDGGDKNKKISYPEYYLKELFQQIMKMSLDRSQMYSALDYLFFEQIKGYFNSENVDRPAFIEDFFALYIRSQKDYENSEIGELWEYLPDWSVNREKIEDNNTASHMLALMRVYWDLIGSEAQINTKLNRRQIQVIDTITEKLFPGINTILWFDIFSFYTSGWGLEKDEDSLHGQIRNHIENDRSFGLVNLTGGAINWEPDEDRRMERTRNIWDNQDKETMYLLGIYFRWLRNPAELNKVIAMIKSMQDEQKIIVNERQKRRLEGLLYDFERLLEFTNNEAENKTKKTGKKK